MKNAKILVMDVDGTLTDGKIYMAPNGEMMKAFNVQDGYGIANILPQIGMLPVIITGRKSQIVEKRAEELKIKYLYQGIHDKLELLKQIVQDMNCTLEDVVYIGDDLNDLLCMENVGYSACPADAVDAVKEKCKYVCKREGGRGAVRELIDKIKVEKEIE